MTDIGINIPLVPCSNLSYDSYNDVLIITLVILSSSSVYTFLEGKNCNFWSSSLVFLLGSKRRSVCQAMRSKEPPWRSAHNCGGPG